MSHAVVAPAVLAFLVFVLSIELVVHFRIQVFELLVILDLVGLKRVVHFFTLINSVLLDVFDFPV